MADDNPYLEAIKPLLSSPDRIVSDEGTVKERPVSDLLDGANALAAAEGAKKKQRGMRTGQMKFPGTP